FEPGVDEVSEAVAQEIYKTLAPTHLRCDAPNRIAQPGETVLDVVLVEPSHWFFGTHQADTWPSRWPGGVQPIRPANEPVSRAYYKAAEAITWSGFDLQRGDLAIEIGSAPGGACGRLLELGLRVIGIDPAEMDPRIAEHPKFRHLRARAGDLPRREFRGAKWLLVDSNVKPNKTLVTVGNIVTNRQSTIEGMLLTLKLGDYEAADSIDQWTDKIQSWNPKEIQIRQLARNKCEVCFAVRL
ncbi:MAG: SAM-dependent methyltransferase, partial [Pirellulaceae bacterium]|nr:SAM-dependent methyltransferase [Pirellulaceae bacterium]